MISDAVCESSRPSNAECQSHSLAVVPVPPKGGWVSRNAASTRASIEWPRPSITISLDDAPASLNLTSVAFATAIGIAELLAP